MPDFLIKTATLINKWVKHKYGLELFNERKSTFGVTFQGILAKTLLHKTPP